MAEGQSQVPGLQCCALQTPTWVGPFLPALDMLTPLSFYRKKVKHFPLLISLLQLLPQLGPSLHSQTSKTLKPDSLSSSSPPTHSSSHPNRGPFPEMAQAKVTNGFHDASSKGLFNILFFLFYPI